MSVKFEDLKGTTIVRIDGGVDDDEMVFATDDGRVFKMVHDQDCCESVAINDIIGDLSDLIGSPISLAEEISSYDAPPPDGYYESYTWTFYKLSTIKGSVTIRWFGESNGYYSEGVSFYEVETSNQ
jgi:hypothetical protein